ncbi:Pentatricopeptide repeat [Macleaya cordata]|uniref:Pentatricopeptide repeat n=1 Tax=Macleaya cordata TaxID=56857 RepID=A0A200R5U0_MACCD|nr:Pentatricopeptide repeat [Macleaya cordata]
MAFISSSAFKQFSRKCNIISRVSRISNPSSFQSLLGFCSSSTTEPSTTETLSSVDQNPIPDKENAVPDSPAAGSEPTQANGAERILRRTPRGKPPNSEKLEDIICRMMANRAWTTRLQNSIRSLVPQFDRSLVWNVLHSARNSEHALQFFRWVEKTGYRHDRSTHLKIIEILGRVSKLNHARCILFDMPKKGVEWDEELFIVLIDSYGKAGIVQESVKIFQKMKELGVERSIKSYDALFKVIMRRGRVLMAKRYFNAMLRDGVLPTRHTYNIMIWGFFLSLKVETAKRFFEEMKEKQISPDVVTYNTMINGYCRVKQMEEADKFFVEMKGKNLIPTVISYTTMIKGYVSVGRVDDGLRLFDEMGSFGIKPNDVTYSTLLPGLCDAEKLPEASKLLKEMVERHLAPKDNSIFLRLMSCQCNSGNMDSAADVLKGMIRLSIPTEAAHYGVLIENFCKVGVYDRAIKLLDKVIEKEILLNPRSSSEMEPSAYNPMIEYLCNHGQTEKAEAFFRQLMKTGVQDPAAFNNLLRGHSKEGTPESALEILKIMGRRGVPSEADAYKFLVESFLKKGEPADAKTALDGMIESGHIPDQELFRSVMESLFNDGRVQTASRVMKSMIEKGVKENMDLVAKILEALFMRGHVEEALGRVELLMDNDCIPDFDSLLAALCDKEKTIAALKLLDYGLERDCNIGFSSCDKVLDALLSAGKTLNAYSILCKIMEKGGVTDRSSCEDLIRSLNAEGNTKQADILSRMLMGGEKATAGKKGKKVAVKAR